jgi:hypothetical protein
MLYILREHKFLFWLPGYGFAINGTGKSSGRTGEWIFG